MRQGSPHSLDAGGPGGRARDAAGPSPSADPRVVHFDSLRGIAALCVVVFHCGTESWINWAPGLGSYTAHLNVGVTLFFLLSGYLLYRPFVTAALAGSPGPSLRRYFRHRAFRILPAYWVALTLLGLWPGLNGVFTQDWWVYYGLLQSYRGSFYGGIGPAWSLSVEATFYLLLPLVAYGMAAACAKVPARQRHALQSRLLLAMGIAGVGLNWLARSQRWSDSIIANWDWFVLGMWLSLVRVRLETEGARPRWLDWCTRNPSVLWLAGFGFYSIVALSGLFPRPLDGQPYPGYVLTLQHLLYAIVAVLLFLPAAFPSGERTLPERILTHRAIADLGKVSYGLFLWHAPLLSTMAKGGVAAWIPSHPFLSLLVPTVSLGVALGWLSYVLIERPFMRFAQSRDRRSQEEGRGFASGGPAGPNGRGGAEGPRTWMKPAAVLLGAALALLIGEFAARRIPDERPIPPQVDVYAEGLRVLSTDQDLKTPHVYGQYKGVLYYSNKDGFRGPDFQVPKPEGVFRIAILGDSVTMGSGVRYKQAYPYLLQEALNARHDGRRYEVMNFGIDGYDFTTSLAELKQHALAYDPDLVVYGFTVNDLEGPLYHVSYNPFYCAWASRLKLVTLLWRQYLAVRDVVWPAWGTYTRELQDNFFDRPEAFAQFHLDMAEFASIVHGRGKCAAMLVHTQLVGLNRFHPFLRFYAAARKAAEGQGVPVIDTFPAFEGRNGHDLWVADGDPHPNPEGHEILGKALLAGLDRLPPSCWGGATPAVRGR